MPEDVSIELLHAVLAAIHLRVNSDPETNIARVAELVFPGQPDAVMEVEQAWRGLGATAQALPWEMETRVRAEPMPSAPGFKTARFTGSWAELGGELSHAIGFLKAGWGLMDNRSTA